MEILVPEYVQALKPYKPGSQQGKVEIREDAKFKFSLASNENPLPTSNEVRNAIVKATNELSRYPDPSSTELVNILADKFNRSPDEIVCTHGSESLIAHIVNAFADINSRILTSEGTFAGIYVHAKKAGRKLNLVPLDDYRFDLEGILNRIKNDTSMIYIANPNNPTGSMITKNEFENFIDKVPKNILVVLDEAYSIYAEQHENHVKGIDYDIPNLLVLQTLSKTHGLAALRIGYAIGPKPIIDTIYKVKYPFEPSLVAQKAAIAAILDDNYVEDTLMLNDLSLKMLLLTFEKLGIKYVKPYANFVLIELPDRIFADKFFRRSYEYGVTVRNCAPFGLPNCIRISSGTKEQTEYAVEVFTKVYEQIKSEHDFNYLK